MYDIVSVYLENGLRVVMHKIPHMKTMACGIWIKQGSKHENDENNGLSHLIEHLMINVRNDNNKEFQELINSVSCEGVSYNAGTTKETTSYYFTGLANMLNKSLKTIASIVIDNKGFKKELIDNEKKVVSQEAISFYSSFNQIKERTTQALWGNLGIGKVIVGDLQNIKNATNREIEDIVEGAYTPENATLVIIGGINYDETLEMVEENFSRWEDRYTRAYHETVDEEPGIYFNSNSGGNNTAISIGFRTPSYMDKDRIGIALITKMIGDISLESRLVKEIRMKRGLAYTVGAFTSFYEQRGSLGLTAVCSKDSPKEVVKIMIDEINKVRESGFDEQELSRAKKILETRTLLDLDNITSQLKFLGKYSSNDSLFSLEQEIRGMRKINIDMIQRIANEIFIEENMGMAAIGKFDIDEVLPILEIG